MRRLIYWILGNAAQLNAFYLCVEIFWATMLASASSFNSAYAIRLGATNTQISLLSSMPALLAVLVALPAGRFLQSRWRRKPWVLGSLLIARMGVLPLILIPRLPFDGISAGTIAVTILIAWTIPTHFFNVGFIPLLSEVVPERDRASVFSTRNIISGGTMAILNILFGLWLKRVAFPSNYQIMYVFGFATSLLSIYFLSKVTAPEAPPAEAPRPPLKSPWHGLVTNLRASPAFTRITFNTLLHGLGLWLATPLYILYFIRVLGADEAWLGLNGAVASLCTLVGFALWRWVINRWGELRTLQHTVLTPGLYPLLVGIFPSLTTILFAGGWNGLMVSGVGLSHFNTLVKFTPPEKRPEYTALYTTIVNIGAFVCPLIGVVLANWFGMRPVLIGCGLLSILGSTSFWIWPVRETNQARQET